MALLSHLAFVFRIELLHCTYYKKSDLKGCVTSRNFLPICKVLSFSLIFLVMMNNDLEVVPCLMILSCWVVVPSSSLVVCTVSSVLQSDTAVCDVSVVSLHTSQKHSVTLYFFLEKILMHWSKIHTLVFLRNTEFGIRYFFKMQMQLIYLK